MKFSLYYVVLILQAALFCNASISQDNQSALNFLKTFNSSQIATLNSTHSQVFDSYDIIKLQRETFQRTANILQKFFKIIKEVVKQKQDFAIDRFLAVLQKLHPKVQNFLYYTVIDVLRLTNHDDFKYFKRLSCRVKSFIQSVLYFVHYKSLISIRNVDEFDSQYKSSSLECFPNELLLLISEYISSDNPLPCVCRRLRRSFTGNYDLKYLAATLSGFEWVKDCFPSGPDRNSLMKLPKFQSKLYKCNFFITELLRNKYRSLAIPLLKFIIESALDAFSEEEWHHYFLFCIAYLIRRYYSSANLIIMAKLKLKYTIASLCILSYDELVSFFSNNSLNFIASDKLRSTYPFWAIAHNSGNLNIISAFEKCTVQEQAKIICTFIKSFDSINPEAMKRLRLIRDCYFPDFHGDYAFIIDIYLKAYEMSLSDQEIVELVHNRNLDDKLFCYLLLSLLNSNKFELAEKIIELEIRPLDYLINKLYEKALDFFQHFNCQKGARKFFRILNLISEKSTIDHDEIKIILQVLFRFYEVESVEFDSSNSIMKLDCKPVSSFGEELIVGINYVKISVIQEFTAPISISLPLNNLIELMGEINSQNLSVLEALLCKLKAKYPQSVIFLSESFLMAAQISDSFNNHLFSFEDDIIFRYTCERLIRPLKYPLDRIIGKIEINFDDLRILNQKYEFEGILKITENSCLGIYESIDCEFFDSFRSFLLYWIESDQWESLSETNNPALLDYLSPEYPGKIGLIKRMKQKIKL